MKKPIIHIPQSNSICNQLSKVFYKLNYEATRSDYNKADYDSAKSAYDSALNEFSKLTGLTFNYTDETDIQFISILVDENHPWAKRQVRDLDLPPGTTSGYFSVEMARIWSQKEIP